MSKTTNSVEAAFSWLRDPDFSVPVNDGGMETYVSHMFAVPRAGDLKTLLEELLETIVGAVNATASVVQIHPLDGQLLQIIGSVGLPDDLVEAENITDLDCGAHGRTVIGRGLYSGDISDCKTRKACGNVNCRFKSMIAIPLEHQNISGEPIGILTLFFNIPPPEDNRVEKIALSFASLLGSVILHHKLLRDKKRAEMIAERQLIANEIHDSLAQTLIYARMRTSMLTEAIRTSNELMSTRYAQDIEDALTKGQKTVRELITDFRCEMDPQGLLHALQTLTEQFRKRNDIVLTYANHVADLELPLEHEIQAYYIVREALANIATHSGASHARLIVDHTFGYYVFTIEDNGSGGCTFTPVEGHYGMMIMRERAQRIGGEIKVESTEGFGTHVQLFFPEPSPDWRTANEQ